MRILLATKNKKKLAELKEILKDEFGVIGLDEIKIKVPDIEEDTDTFAGNAVKKAVITAYHTKMLTVADDSGLEVLALGGKPGVYSARFAGPQKDDNANNEKVLSLLSGVTDRRARFVCYVAVADACGLLGVVSGEVWGQISTRMEGDFGFGYDPIFIPQGYDKSFAQLGPEVKHKISHRKIALAKAANLLKIYTSPL